MLKRLGTYTQVMLKVYPLSTSRIELSRHESELPLNRKILGVNKHIKGRFHTELRIVCSKPIIIIIIISIKTIFIHAYPFSNS